MSFADDMIETSLEMISEYGSDITLKKKASTNYNVVTGENETVAGAEIPIKAHIKAYTSEQIVGLINVGDINILVAYDEAVSYDISSDTIIIGSTSYNIINLEPLVVQSKVITYSLQVRK